MMKPTRKDLYDIIDDDPRSLYEWEGYTDEVLSDFKDAEDLIFRAAWMTDMVDNLLYPHLKEADPELYKKLMDDGLPSVYRELINSRPEYSNAIDPFFQN